MFGMDPNFGANPFIAPQFLPNAIEHIKQHMTLWYLNRMNGYVANLRDGQPVDDYDNPNLTAIIDKLYATVGQHVAMDSQQVFSQILPQLQQLMQSQQQNKQQAVLPPDAQVVKDTSMAETQRKAAKDTQDIQLAQAKMKDDQMRLQAEMQAKAQNDERDAQLKLQLAAMDADTKIKIENARLTHETIQQANQLAVPPQPAEMPPTEGAPNGNQ
jgi:hypothetical protein